VPHPPRAQPCQACAEAHCAAVRSSMSVRPERPARS
jgi:hypothetical protein